MTPEREAELFLKTDMLIEVCRSLQSEQKMLGERVARVEAGSRNRANSFSSRWRAGIPGNRRRNGT